VSHHRTADVSVPPVPQEVLLLRHLVGLAALGRAPPRPWHLEAALATVAQCSAGAGGRCSAVAAAAAAAALEDAVGLEEAVVDLEAEVDLRAPRRPSFRLPAHYQRAGAAGAAKSEAHQLHMFVRPSDVSGIWREHQTC
jgi:hypothetical protein